MEVAKVAEHKVIEKADPTAVWKGLTKVKNMSWRAVL